MQKLLKILEERLTGQKGHYTLILLDIDFFSSLSSAFFIRCL